MIGNPVYYGEEHRQYTKENLEKLREMGADTILVNIAWSRPYIDAVLLEHVAVSDKYPLMSSDKNTVERYSSALKMRSEAVHEAGMKSLGLFGIPQYLPYANLPDEYQKLRGSTQSNVASPDDQVTCILSPETVEYYKELLTKAIETCGLDGILIYTCDELADVCDETSDCPRCHGIPLEDRIPGFLNELYNHCLTVKPGFEMWWEPWEFSASQTYLCLEKLDTGIGVACHSTLHEVYHINHPDPWLRNMGMLCKRSGRQLMVEMFLSGSGEELGPIRGYPCPRLTYEQIRSLDLLEGVTCVKEYFGTAMKFFSVNEQMAELAMKSEEDYDRLINKIASRFTDDISVREKLIEAWEESSQALLMTPWDISWVFRFSNFQPYDPAWYGKVSFVNSMRTPWKTPSWESNRRSYYMITATAGNMSENAWKDMDKRMTIALGLCGSAETKLRNLQYISGELKMQADALQCFRVILKSRQNYMRLSLMLENKDTGESDLRGLIEDEIKNADEFVLILRNMNIDYYFDSEKTENGLKWLSHIYESRESVRKFFFE